MTTHLFEIENDRYTDRIDPAAAWVAGCTPNCDWSAMVRATAGDFCGDPCTCGHESLRALAVPGPVGCVIVEVTDGKWRRWHHGGDRHCYPSHYDDPIREAWDRLCQSHRRRQLGVGGQNATMQAEAITPDDGLYALVDGELRSVEDMTHVWERYASEGHPPDRRCGLIWTAHLPSTKHLIFTNNRGDEVVVEREMLS